MNKITCLGIIFSLGAVFLGCTGDTPGKSGDTTAVDGKIAVTVDTVKRATLRGYVVAYGTVRPEAGDGGEMSGSVRITAPVTGVISSVRCSEFKPVRQGQTLFTFDTTVADARVRGAGSSLHAAEQAYERQKQMREIDATSQKQFLEIQRQLEAARSALSTAERERSLLEVKAPISGVVGRITARNGETVNTADVMTSISNPDRQLVVADVPVDEISVIAPNQQVLVERTAKTDSSYVIEGIVRAIGETVDQVNDTVEVIISLPEDTRVRSGEFVKVAIAWTEHADCLAVPSASVVFDPDGHATVAEVAGGMAVQRNVVVGLQENGLTEISGEGIQPGTVIVSVGAYGLPDSSAVQVLEQ